MIPHIAIDPGPEQSAILFMSSNGIPSSFAKTSNESVLGFLVANSNGRTWEFLAIEMIASYGMAVGQEVFETCVWIGRFIQAWNGPHALIYRKTVTSFVCGSGKAKDSNVRQALIDRYGGKHKAIGNKKSPGPLYGMKDDMWSALAVAVTFGGTVTSPGSP